MSTQVEQLYHIAHLTHLGRLLCYLDVLSFVNLINNDCTSAQNNSIEWKHLLHNFSFGQPTDMVFKPNQVR